MEQKYIDLLNEFLEKIDELDKETPWQEIEPVWWLEMMGLQKIVYEALDIQLKRLDTLRELRKISKEYNTSYRIIKSEE